MGMQFTGQLLSLGQLHSKQFEVRIVEKCLPVLGMRPFLSQKLPPDFPKRDCSPICIMELFVRRQLLVTTNSQGIFELPASFQYIGDPSLRAGTRANVAEPLKGR